PRPAGVRPDKEVRPMRSAVVLLILSTGASGLSAAELDVVRLRQAARLPSTEAMVGFGWNSTRGFHLPGPPPDPRPEIERLQKALTGDMRDAERYLQLASLYTEQKDAPRSQEAGEKAVDLYRQQLKSESANGALMARLGQALDGCNKKTEAERVLRQAVPTAPADPETWLALAYFLTGRGMAILVDATPDPGKPHRGGEVLVLAMNGRISRGVGEE